MKFSFPDTKEYHDYHDKLGKVVIDSYDIVLGVIDTSTSKAGFGLAGMKLVFVIQWVASKYPDAFNVH